MNYLALAVITALLMLVVLLLARRTRSDTAGDFRRQINALSSESRRSVVDQVQNLERRSGIGSEQPDSPEVGEADRNDGP
jgi:hypothetical protein